MRISDWSSDVCSSDLDELRIFDLRVPGSSTAYDAIVASGRNFEDARLSDDDVMAICYTSGTTGVPKVAPLTHRAVDPAMQGMILTFALRGCDERRLNLTPLPFTGGRRSHIAPSRV